MVARGVGAAPAELAAVRVALPGELECDRTATIRLPPEERVLQHLLRRRPASHARSSEPRPREVRWVRVRVRCRLGARRRVRVRVRVRVRCRLGARRRGVACELSTQPHPTVRIKAVRFLAD